MKNMKNCEPETARLEANARDLFELSADDSAFISKIEGLYDAFLAEIPEEGKFDGDNEKCRATMKQIGDQMQELCATSAKNLHVFSFETSVDNQAEASRVVAKLRDIKTKQAEFIYYTQRAFEMLFKLAFVNKNTTEKNYLIVKTPVTDPIQQYAYHKIPNIDGQIENTVMCVMLRGALLPSMIVSKEIEEYSSHAYITPFALFKVRRDETKLESTMKYLLDLDLSFFDWKSLDGKDLIFADPMNATGGSFLTIVDYIRNNSRPASIKFFNIITALKGGLRVARSLPDCEIYTLWLDPVLNKRAYILPGLGDAGDRLNGIDENDAPRNMIQLLADYGSNISNLYRDQLRQIEKTVLG